MPRAGRDLADQPSWLTITSWQGKGDDTGLHIDRLEKIGPDVYRKTEPMPFPRHWKRMLSPGAARAAPAPGAVVTRSSVGPIPAR